MTHGRHFFTLNECATFVELGHATGVFAPGLKLPSGRLNQVRHHALLAHGLAVKAIRARSRAGTQTGPAENVSVCVPVIETPEHIAAAELATRELNAPYLTAIMEGRYRESFLAAAGADAPKVAAEDMNAIGTPVDFIGINVYLPGSYVSASDAAPGFVSVPFPAKYPTMNSSWLKIGPEALYWGPRNVAKVWNVSDIYITENGCSATDVPAADGVVYDTDRIMFLRSYLTQLQRATSEGVPVRGYFHWSLMERARSTSPRTAARRPTCRPRTASSTFSSVRTRRARVRPCRQFPCNVDVCKRKDPGIGLDRVRRDFSVENAYPDSTIADHIHPASR